MEWIVHDERALYESEWVSLAIADVEVPGVRRFDHHLIHVGPAAGVVVHDPDRGVLLLWRHRFITDSWGWEIPAGRVDAGESIEEAAARETLEETGWRPGDLRPLTAFFPTNGLSDQAFHIFTAESATHEGPPADPSESSRIEWLPVPELRRAIAEGEMRDGLSLTACCYALAFGDLTPLPTDPTR
ncbi:MAG: NUDIX hydrolase [Acidimicrobiales bacterium]